MNTFKLKIAGFAVLVVVVIVTVKFFRSSETIPKAESRGTKQVRENESNLETQLKTAKSEEKQLRGQELKAKRAVKSSKVKRSETVQAEEQDPQVEGLYQMALLQKENTEISPKLRYRIIMDCCRYIQKKFPDSPQAEKAKGLIQEVPEQYQKQYEQEMSFLYPDKPRVKKSRSLRRRRRVQKQMPERYHVPDEINISQ